VIYYVLAGLVASIVQLIISFSCKRLLIKLVPMFLSLSFLIYAGMRFIGIITLPGDADGIFVDGLVSGLFGSLLAFSFIVGLLFAWCVYCIVKWKRTN